MVHVDIIPGSVELMCIFVWTVTDSNLLTVLNCFFVTVTIVVIIGNLEFFSISLWMQVLISSP